MDRMACETEKSFMSVICTKIGVGLECGEWMGECGESMETNGACDLMPPPPQNAHVCRKWEYLGRLVPRVVTRTRIGGGASVAGAMRMCAENGNLSVVFLPRRATRTRIGRGVKRNETRGACDSMPNMGMCAENGCVCLFFCLGAQLGLVLGEAPS